MRREHELEILHRTPADPRLHAFDTFRDTYHIRIDRDQRNITDIHGQISHRERLDGDLPMTNLDEAVEQIDNRTVYAIGCGAFGYVVYSLAKNYLRNIASIFKPEPPATGYVPGQVGHSDKPKGNWRPTGRYDEHGGEIIEFGGN